MSETIGTARLDIVVDTSQFDAAITSAKRSVSGMSAAAQAEYNKLNGAEKRRVDSLIKQADTIGFTRQQQILYNASLKNVPTAVLDELKVKLAATAQATHAMAASTVAVSAGLSGNAKSAKELQFALRGVPAQFTDIATSLASGQRPLQVLLQQGGQLKDMFGGVGAAARALGGYVVGLINPVTLAIAAFVGLTAAVLQADKQQAALANSLILTGNAAGTTVKQLNEMSAAVAKSANTSGSNAKAIEAQVAATGKFTADQLASVSTAAAQMEQATGRAVSATIADFVSLQENPVDAIQKLNAAIGDGTNVTHFLTESTLDQIRALQEQGRESEASRVAIAAYFAAINDRAPEAAANLSELSKAWIGIKNEASSLAEGVVTAFNYIIAAESRAAKAIEAFERHFSDTAADAFHFITSKVQALTDAPQSKIKVGVEPIVDPVKQAALLKFQQDGLKYLTLQEQKQRALNQAQAEGIAAGITDVTLLVKRRRAIIKEFDDRIAAEAKSAAGSSGSPRIGHHASATQDFAKNAAADLQKMVAEEDRATQSYKDLAATLSGPLAVAEREHEKNVERINELASQSAIAAQGKDALLRQETQRYADQTAATKKQLDPYGQLLDAKKKEIDLSGIGAAAYQTEMDLRGASTEQILEYKDALLAANQAAIDNQKAVSAMDDFRASATDALASFLDGSKSAKDAFKDFANSIIQQIARIIAQKAIFGLFGEQGTNGSGSSGGGGLFSIFSGLFGSAKGNVFNAGRPLAFAQGGVVDRMSLFPMSNGGIGSIAEGNKPEAIMPLKRLPGGDLGVQVAGGRGGRPVAINQSIYVQGLMDSRTPSQIASASAREQRRAQTRLS